MATQKNLGITAPVPKEEWNSTTPYYKLNIVRHNGGSYIARENNVNIEPEVHARWSEFWLLISKDGEQGEKGERGDRGEQGVQGEQGIQGATGAKLINQELVGQDENGGNIYQQTFDDGTVAYFTAPRGAQGEASTEEGEDLLTKTEADEIYIHKSYRTANSNKTLYQLCDITDQNNPDWLMVNAGGTFGLGRASSSGGWTLAINAATKATIEAQSNTYQPIVPSRISDAVVVGLTANKNILTDEQKAAVMAWLGAVAKAPTPTGYAAVYAIDRQGNDITVSYSPQVSTHTIAQRGVGGTLFIGEPTDDKHATTKKYVDDLVKELTARIVELESKVN